MKNRSLLFAYLLVWSLVGGGIYLLWHWAYFSPLLTGNSCDQKKNALVDTSSPQPHHAGPAVQNRPLHPLLTTAGSLMWESQNLQKIVSPTRSLPASWMHAVENTQIPCINLRTTAGDTETTRLLHTLDSLLTPETSDAIDARSLTLVLFWPEEKIPFFEQNVPLSTLNIASSTPETSISSQNVLIYPLLMQVDSITGSPIYIQEPVKLNVPKQNLAPLPWLAQISQIICSKKHQDSLQQAILEHIQMQRPLNKTRARPMVSLAIHAELSIN